MRLRVVLNRSSSGVCVQAVVGKVVEGEAQEQDGQTDRQVVQDDQSEQVPRHDRGRARAEDDDPCREQFDPLAAGA